jgi:energy-coupling factor transporter ATP-binding protein EcfA2
MAKNTNLRQVERIPEEKTPSGNTQTQAIDLILKDASETGEGERIIILGASRKGKTTFAKLLSRAVLDKGIAQRLLIHDQKFPDQAQYEGAKVSHESSLRQAYLQAQSIVLREPLPAETAAHLAREAVEAKIKTCVFIDEGAFALKKNDDEEPIDRAWQGPDLAWMQCQGGACGVSSITLWQMPKQAPGSAIDNARIFVVFALGGRSLAYAKDLRIIPPEALETVIALGVGEFCVFLGDREWDQKVYGPK